MSHNLIVTNVFLMYLVLVLPCVTLIKDSEKCHNNDCVICFANAQKHYRNYIMCIVYLHASYLLYYH